MHQAMISDLDFGIDNPSMEGYLITGAMINFRYEC